MTSGTFPTHPCLYCWSAPSCQSPEPARRGISRKREKHRVHPTLFTIRDLFVTRGSAAILADVSPSLRITHTHTHTHRHIRGQCPSHMFRQTTPRSLSFAQRWFRWGGMVGSQMTGRMAARLQAMLGAWRLACRACRTRFVPANPMHSRFGVIL